MVNSIVGEDLAAGSAGSSDKWRVWWTLRTKSEIILILPTTDLGRTKGLQFRPLSKIAFYIFVTNFLILMQLGAKHVESPFIEFGQISTALYFAHFFVLVPAISIIENTLIDLYLANNKSR